MVTKSEQTILKHLPALYSAVRKDLLHKILGNPPSKATATILDQLTQDLTALAKEDLYEELINDKGTQATAHLASKPIKKGLAWNPVIKKGADGRFELRLPDGRVVRRARVRDLHLIAKQTNVSASATIRHGKYTT